MIDLPGVSKHIKVLAEAGLVRRDGTSHRSPVSLDAEVFDMATAWIERYRRQAEERYRRLDAVLARMDDERHPEEGRAG
jgi:DNA-binding transcriptional ArsR family regulator